MKASGVDIPISAAFAGITNIVNGKAWTNALRAYRLIIAVLLHNYARYLSWYVRQMEHLPQRAKEDLLAGAHVCRHSDGGTAVPADQFGEQTHIKRGKGSGGMKGISTSPEQVAVWVNSFSVCAHLDIAMEHMYNEAGEEQKPHGEVDGEEKNKHKEEGQGRRRLDEVDRKTIAVELKKYSPPSMTSNQVSITSAMAKWRQTQ